MGGAGGFTRLLANGTRDTTFGTDGFVLRPRGSSNAIAIDSLDRIISVGEVNPMPGVGNDFIIIRFTANGQLDQTFGANGVVQTDFTGDLDFATDLVIQPDNKIIAVGGSFLGGPGTCEFAAARYLENGDLDPSFGSAGKATLPVGPFNDFAGAVARLTEGKLIITGRKVNTSDLDLALYRLESNGAPDPTFGVGGLVVVDTPSNFIPNRGLGIQTDGKLVITNNSFLLRLHPDGVPDGSFGTNGISRVDALTQLQNSTLSFDGKIIAVGYVNKNSNDNVFVGRYLSEILTTFPVTVSGRVTTPGGIAIRNAVVSLTDPQGVRRTATTSSFGVYSFQNVSSNATYIISVSSKRYRFAPLTQMVTTNLSNVDFVGLE